MTTRYSTARAWAVSGVVFAASLMVLLGIWQIFVGIAAIVEDEFFVVAPNYTYEIDTTAWGWIHLILGIVIALAGFFLFTGSAWARVVGIVLAVFSAIANFFFLPYYPLWSIVMIALAVFVIWALTSSWSSRPSDDLTVGMADRGQHRGQPGEDGWTTGAQPASRSGASPATPSGMPPATPSGTPPGTRSGTPPGTRSGTPPTRPSGPGSP